MHADHGSCTLAIEVQVADVVFFCCAFEALRIVGIERTRQAVFSIVGDPQSVVEIFGLNNCQHGSKDLFLGNAGLWINIGDDGWLDEVDGAKMLSSCEQPTI